MLILIVTAVESEKQALEAGLGGDSRFVVLAGGVGPAAAASSSTKAILEGRYDCVVSAGIGGGFVGQADIGDLVIATEIVAADVGVETGDEAMFASVEELDFGKNRFEVDPSISLKLEQAFQENGLPIRSGPILTVSTATGTARTEAQLRERVPNAAAEAMEGAGVAAAAQLCGVPCIELRAISNTVGPRDRSSWRIQEAFALLTQAARVMKEVL